MPRVTEVGVGGDYDVSQMARLVFSLNLADVAHHDIDKSIFDQGEKHEYCARRHEDVYSLKKEVISLEKGRKDRTKNSEYDGSSNLTV